MCDVTSLARSVERLYRYYARDTGCRPGVELPEPPFWVAVPVFQYMGYELIDINELDEVPDRTATGYEISDHYLPFRDDGEEPRPASRGPEQFGFRVYFIDPGEELGSGRMHYHEEQEELFYVVAGVLHVETPDETFEVGPGQALVIDPGNPQRAYASADAERPVYVVAAGAPSYRTLGRNDGMQYEPEDG